MSSVVFSMGPWRTVHEIVVKTAAGRSCSILIHEEPAGGYDTSVVISDPVGLEPKAVDCSVRTTTATSTAKDHFEEALKLIEAYLASVAKTDAMVDFHNPCNCPFVSESDQNAILSAKGLKHTVRVN